MADQELSPDLLKIAIRDLNEDPKRRQADIDAIKTWLSQQPHLTARMDDKWILTFLRGCKFSLERTKEKFDTLYTFRTLLPEYFGNRDPMQKDVQELLDVGTTFPLPKPDAKGRSMFLIKTSKADPKKYNVKSMMKLNFINLEVLLLDDVRRSIAGDVVILDYKGCNMDHITAFTPTMAKQAVKIYQEAYPIRPQEVHIINANVFFEKSFAILKTFMKKKLQKRIYIHSNTEKVFEYISRDNMPMDYGGNLQNSEELAGEWRKKVESYREWFLEDGKFKSNEKLRPGKPKTTSDVFGVEGSFRALEVD